MAKTVLNDVLDAALNVVKNSCNKITLLTGQPADFAAANTGALVLASITVDSTDFTIADGDTSGRKATVAEQAGTGSAGGTATVIALLDTVGSRLLYTTDGSFVVTNGQAFTLQAFDIEIADPA